VSTKIKEWGPEVNPPLRASGKEKVLAGIRIPSPGDADHGLAVDIGI